MSSSPVICCKEIALQVSEFLDPMSFYHWALVWMNEEANDGGALLPPETVATLDRLRRLGEALPSHIAYSNPIEVIAPLQDVIMNNNDEIWQHKKRVFRGNHPLFPREEVANQQHNSVWLGNRGSSGMNERVQAWLLGNPVSIAATATSFLSNVVTFFLDYVRVRNGNYFSQNVFFRDDFAVVADLMNIKCSFPLEKTYELPLFTPGWSMVGTLRDIATLEPREDEWLASDTQFSTDNLPHDEQVTRSKRNVERYLQHEDETRITVEDLWYECFRNNVVCDDSIAFQSDPGDENMSDTDWDEWICNQNEMDWDLENNDEIKIETDRRFPIFEKEVVDGLQTFVNALPSLTPEDPSITNPNFRLCRLAFRDIVQQELCPDRLRGTLASLSVAHSATDFLQRIIEDICFGTVIRPFKVNAPSIGVSVCCIVILGDIHGTTAFCFEECSQDEDDDDERHNGEDHGDSSDSDADHDPDFSDMEESDDDDDVGEP